MFKMLQNVLLTTVMSCQTHLQGIGYDMVFNSMYSVTKLQGEDKVCVWGGVYKIIKSICVRTGKIAGISCSMPISCV